MTTLLHLTVLFLIMAISTLRANGQVPIDSLLVPGGDKWKLVWNDEFDQPDSLLDQKWESQNGPSGHILCSR